MSQPAPGNLEKREPKLLDRVREAMRVRHLSLRTEKTYVHWIRRYILFHGKRHPQEMAEVEINAFLTHLAVEGKVSPSTQTQALCAILFLYRIVLGREVGELEGLVRAQRKKKLPVVLTQDEVKGLLSCTDSVNRLFLSLLYGTGMRLTEALRLRVKDVDFGYDQITVRDGKGAKDRMTMLPTSLKAGLQEHLKGVKKLHESDLQAGGGSVYLPYALARKYPRADREWGWQFVFPAPSFSVYPRTGERRRHHLQQHQNNNDLYPCQPAGSLPSGQSARLAGRQQEGSTLVAGDLPPGLLQWTGDGRHRPPFRAGFPREVSRPTQPGPSADPGSHRELQDCRFRRAYLRVCPVRCAQDRL